MIKIGSGKNLESHWTGKLAPHLFFAVVFTLVSIYDSLNAQIKPEDIDEHLVHLYELETSLDHWSQEGRQHQQSALVCPVWLPKAQVTFH